MANLPATGNLMLQRHCSFSPIPAGMLLVTAIFAVRGLISEKVREILRLWVRSSDWQKVLVWGWGLVWGY